MDLRDELATVKKHVEDLLEHYEETRNDDRYLLILYWKQVDKLPLPFVPWDVIQGLTSPETIRRMRQKIQAEGRFKPTDPEVEAKRQDRSREMRRVISGV